MAEMFVKGRIVLVDDEQLFRLSKFNWFLTREGYVATKILPHVGQYIPAGKTISDTRRTVYMHQMVFGPVPDGHEIDHKNRVKTDNRRENLIPKTHAENMLNVPERREGKTKGVYPSGKKWMVILRLSCGQLKYFGTFPTITEANECALNEYANIHRGQIFNIAC